MQFLLFLSAMLAGFTGLMSGDRAAPPSRVEQAVAAAAIVAEVAPVSAEAAAHVARPAAVQPVRVQMPLPAASPRLPSLARVDERRLE